MKRYSLKAKVHKALMAALLFMPSAVYPEIAGDGIVPVKQGRLVNLCLSDTIRLALRNQAMFRSAHERVSEAKGVELQMLSEYLPHLSAAAYQQRVWHENLAAMGFPSWGVIGPFNDFDARLIFTQKLFDMSALSRAQQGYVGVEIASLQEDFARQKVVLIATLAYLGALRGFNDLKASTADYSLARRLLTQAWHQEQAQIASGIDVARAKTRVALEKLRVSQARLRYHEAITELLRTTGLPLGLKVRLSEPLRFIEDPGCDPAEDMATAGKNRIEIRVAEKQVRFEEHKLSEASLAMIPDLDLGADYGWNGPQLNEKVASTGQGMLRASVPIFDGGLIQGKIRQAASRREQARIAFTDVQTQVEEDVRLAVRRVATGKDRFQTARQVVQLAERELKMARDRFASGLGDNIEVLSAQTSLAAAHDGYVGALTEYHMARVNYYSSIGCVDDFRLEGPENRSLPRRVAAG